MWNSACNLHLDGLVFRLVMIAMTITGFPGRKTQLNWALTRLDYLFSFS